jgi:hypothetical protein
VAPEPSSQVGASFTGTTVTLIVARPESTVPSFALTVKESSPEKSAAGV